MTNDILNKVNELFDVTDIDVSVGFGYKQVNGQYTDEKSIIFGVKTKLPLSELKQEDVLPSVIEINGSAYNTDVVQNGGFNFLACDNSVTNPCFPYGYPPDALLTPNNNRQVPLLGGSVFSNFSSSGGTLGFIAKHTLTGKLVGVTNSHTLYTVNFNSTSLQYFSDLYMFPFGNVQSQFQIFKSNPQRFDWDANIIGKSLYIKRLVRNPFKNKVDGGIMSLTEKDRYFNNRITTESWKQVGLDIGTTPPPFATTSELDALLDDPNLEIASSGFRTGPKQGACGLKIRQIHFSTSIGLDYSFKDCIEVTRINPDCLWPVGPGDSGSAAFAKIGGVWKIIGLVFAGSYYNDSGVICRIDHVASELGIEAWDGTITPTSFVDPSSIKNIVTKGVSGEDSITVDGKLYRQGFATTYPVGDYPTYNYTVELYPVGCSDLSIKQVYNVYSKIPAQVGKWYTYYDYSGFGNNGYMPIKVVSTTNVFGNYEYTTIFQQTPRDTCES